MGVSAGDGVSVGCGAAVTVGGDIAVMVSTISAGATVRVGRGILVGAAGDGLELQAAKDAANTSTKIAYKPGRFVKPSGL